MSIARARAFQSLNASLRHAGTRATPRLSAPARTKLAIGRRYASGGGSHAPPSSDLPWALGGLIVTIPSCWYLWPSSSHADSGHHGEHEEHAEEHEEKEDAGEGEASEGEDKPAEESEQKDEQPEPKQDDGGEKKDEGEKSDDSAQDTTPEQEAAKEDEQTAKPSGSQGESMPTGPDANKISSRTEGSEDKETPDHKGNTSGVQLKGKMMESSDGTTDTRKREPDSKGAYKKRIDSGLQKDLGTKEQGDQSGEDREDASSSKASKAAGGGSMASKQGGMSNTATRHSTQIDEDPEKSKKGEGTPETSKAMGTVSINRPQV